MKHPVYALMVAASLSVGMAVTPCDVSAQILAPEPVAEASDARSSSDFTPSLGRIFADTITDFRRLPSLDSAVILSMGGLVAAIGHPADVRVSNGFSSSQSMKGPFSAGQTIGAATTQLAGAFGTYSIGRMTGNPKVAVIGADLVRAQFVSQAITQAIKFSVGRTRPDGTSLSFPSGHTASAFATAAVLQRHLGWKAGIPAYGVAAYVARVAHSDEAALPQRRRLRRRNRHHGGAHGHDWQRRGALRGRAGRGTRRRWRELHLGRAKANRDRGSGIAIRDQKLLNSAELGAEFLLTQ